MDIQEKIKAVRELITKETPEALREPLYALIYYAFASIDSLNEDKPLKQQIADCLLLGGKQVLDKFPDKAFPHDILGFSSFLTDNIKGLCQHATACLERLEKDVPFTDKDFYSYITFYLDFLPEKAQQLFLDSMTIALENNFPESAASFYIKAMDSRVNNDQALQYLLQALARNKDSILTILGIAYIYYFDKNWKNAIVYFKRSIDIDISLSGFEKESFSPDARTYFDLAWCYGKIKDYENEIASYKECLESDPKYPYALNNLGWAYERLKDYKQALSYYQQSIKMGKDKSYPYRNTVKVLKKLKRYDEALAFLEKNKSRFPKAFDKEVRTIKDLIAKEKVLTLKEKQHPTKTDDGDDTDESESIEAVIEHPKKSSTFSRSNKVFTAESHLENEFVAQIDRGMPFANMPLKMYDSPDGYGKQYPIPGIGRIDILAVNTDTDDIYVIELKKGLGDDEIVGQVSRYMGWVKEHLASSSQNVYGIICVAQATDKLKYAVEANPNISLLSYSFQTTPLYGL